ncbi:ATP-binding protein [Escherichia albertii]|uniref:ATP-binding protein n=1 Tax=Escherichia albertii TaxID=208962 RepID=UPI0011EC0B4A|nr:ATP-binding protein [Escherichia albertii]
MKELVVLSGKGGTGKTSITASFARLARQSVIADCDVDAADLHLVLSPSLNQRIPFYSGNLASIRQDECISCGICESLCRFGAILTNPVDGTVVIDPTSCEGCGVCLYICPVASIDFTKRFCGHWMISDTDFGLLVHAHLGITAENSGKLVSQVRKAARQIAEQQQRELIIVDGPPGNGCTVIASITGASQVLLVTEPSLSGLHDMVRVLELTRHFSIPTAVCINKWDINPDVTEQLEIQAIQSGANLAGRIRYDPSVSLAQNQGKAVIDISCPSAEDIRNVWNALKLQ